VTAAVFFALYVAAAGLLGPAVLDGRWAARSPRLAISLWLVLPVSWLAAVLMAVLAATAPFPLTWSGPPGRGRALLAGPPVPGGAAIAAAGLLVAAAVALRAGWCLTAQTVRGRRDRREHAALVAATGHPGPERDVVILGHDAPAVYCLPCGRSRIVISAGALAALTPGQIRAVLAHERAHLRGRHHAMLAFAAALARAFPRVPLLARAGPQLAVLTEMAADDAAARRHCRDDLAGALVVLARRGARPTAGPATPATGPAALAAAGPAALARLRRLLTPPARRRTAPAWLAAVTGLLLPAAIACLPLLIAACDVTGHP
jgi:Zn-dependent protease with chaperone function